MAILGQEKAFTLDKEQFKLWLKQKLSEQGAGSLAEAEGSLLGLESFARRETEPVAAWLDDLAQNLDLVAHEESLSTAAVAINLFWDQLLDYDVVKSPDRIKLELWPLTNNQLLLLLMPSGQFGPQRQVGPQLLLTDAALGMGENLNGPEAVQELWQTGWQILEHANSLLNTVALSDIESSYPIGEWKVDRAKLEGFVRDKLGAQSNIIPSLRAGVPLGEINKAFVRAFKNLLEIEAIIPPPRIPLSALNIWAIDDPSHEPLLLQLSLPTTDAMRQARQMYVPLRFLNSWARPHDWDSGIDEIFDAMTLILDYFTQLIPRNDNIGNQTKSLPF